ncbi:MAG: hypothetical protein M3081_08025 [Gemmatimonadota bacterium]|nr:hypothetical protein [Gemmatimonadota bacterium]
MFPRKALSIAVAASSLLLGACGLVKHDPVTEVTADAYVNTRWRGSLVTPATLAGAVQMNGTAIMQPGKSAGNTDLSVNLSNATPGGLHPWQLRRGQCGQDEGVIGPAGAYQAVKIGSNGRGSGVATVPMATPTSGSFFVTVQASAANPETIVACGNLAPPAS